VDDEERMNSPCSAWHDIHDPHEALIFLFDNKDISIGHQE
jgi:hypothetical protein